MKEKLKVFPADESVKKWCISGFPVNVKMDRCHFGTGGWGWSLYIEFGDASQRSYERAFTRGRLDESGRRNLAADGRSLARPKHSTHSPRTLRLIRIHHAELFSIFPQRHPSTDRINGYLMRASAVAIISPVVNPWLSLPH